MRTIVAIGAIAVGSLGGASAQEPEPRYRGVWEPVGYPADVQLNDVYFVTPDVGWVTGGVTSGGVILHTRDGGATWSVQLGDPRSTERAYEELRFVDERTGFATHPTGMDRKLLRTTDGETWAVSGTIEEHLSDYEFLSPTLGFVVHGADISVTTDAGKSWRPIFTCRVTMNVSGLTREAACHLAALHFPSRSVGYAVGRSYDVTGYFFVAKTTDGGATWSASAVPAERGADEVFFIDEARGFARTESGALFSTADGGTSWQELPASAGERIRFADPEVGWSFLRHTSTLSYTTDGGKRWNSREIGLPATVNAFSFPRRDRGYAVGDHGMVFRYRVVPAAEPTPNALEGPVMPEFGPGLEGAVGRAQAGLEALRRAVSGSAPCCAEGTEALTAASAELSTAVPQFLGGRRNLNLPLVAARWDELLPRRAGEFGAAVESLALTSDPAAADEGMRRLESAVEDLGRTVRHASGRELPAPGEYGSAAADAVPAVFAAPAGSGASPDDPAAPTQEAGKADGQGAGVLDKVGKKVKKKVRFP